MPSGSYYQQRVQCPFYRYDEGRRITCEGLFGDSFLEVRCGSKEAYRKHIETLCCEHYKACVLYRLLMKKYEED